ncbi:MULTISPECIES: hypothetical protein [Roseomonadaceae]|uniref:Uncharacterized protein n=1 Tax=Falsiroseomonas oleicola TaxID=2801474 RepID=A0ABS6HD10_9PROT|nr:hypothetical protein [Roseomonas oleicola]MBU8546616.1 hypothetical protein [Roseomonas oleicola]
MSDKVPIDAAGLRAAVSDQRYWQAGHPERDAWRAWVTDGFQAMYGGDARPSSGVVHVRAYVRNGQPVAAHTRGAPASGDEGGIDDRIGQPARDGQIETPGPVDVGFRGLMLRRRNLLNDALVVPAMARRPENGVVGGRSGVIPEGGGGGGGYRPPGSRGPAQVPQAPTVSRRGQELVDMVAPGGQPIGSQRGGAEANIRTLPGGQAGAEAMLGRLTQGRGAVDITPRGHPGRMYRLDDGTIIGYRPSTSSGSPSIDLNIPGFTSVRKLHF